MIQFKNENKKNLRGGSFYSPEADVAVMLEGFLRPSLHQSFRLAGKLKVKKRRT